MAIKLGKDCKLYIGTAGTQAATLDDNVKDLEIDMSNDEWEATTRGSAGWEESVATITKAEIKVDKVFKVGDSNFAAYRDAFLNKTAISVLAFDGLKATVGNQGLDADMIVGKFPINQKLKEGVNYSFTLKPTPSSRTPAWFTAS